MLQLRASKLDAIATQRAAHDAQRGADRMHSVETRVNSSLLTAVHRYMPLARSGPCFSEQGCLSVRGARVWVGRSCFCACVGGLNCMWYSQSVDSSFNIQHDI